MPLRLKPDKVMRDRFFTPQSFSHPAKGHLGLWWEILERYTRPGEWVLDPMAGVGATMLGALMGRNVICLEKERHFVDPMQASWAKMRQNPMLGCELGQVVILRGDARCLSLGQVEAVVTSPPYEGTNIGREESLGEAPFGGSNSQARGYRYTRRQIDAAVFSPPYGGIVGDQKEGPGAGANEERYGRWAKRTAKQNSYTQVAAAIFSPPYENSELPREDHDLTRSDGIHPRYRYDGGIGDNIGNLRGPAYWEAMSQVYAECHRVLKPHGLMVLVLKGFTRDGEYVDLPAQTQALVETLGFSFVETWQRELWNLSFWRILQRRRDPGGWDDRLRFEQVLAMRKL